jgi:hypothetical protein
MQILPQLLFGQVMPIFGLFAMEIDGMPVLGAFSGFIDLDWLNYNLGQTRGQESLEFYASMLDDTTLPWYQRIGAWVGGFFSALWTPSTWQQTTLVLGGALATDVLLVRLAPKWAHFPHKHGHQFYHIQINEKCRIEVPKFFINIFRKEYTLKKIYKALKYGELYKLSPF